MRLKNISIFAAVAALSAGLALPHAAAAQGEGAGRFKGASDWVERNVNANTPKRMVYTSARGLGMLRGLQEDDMFVRLRYKGAGTAYVPAKAGAWTAIPLSNYYVEISYPEGVFIATGALVFAILWPIVVAWYWLRSLWRIGRSFYGELLFDLWDAWKHRGEP